MANGITTLTSNQEVDYIVKDFNSATDAMISFANVNFGPGTDANRLWTNFNKSSFSRNWLEIVAYVADVFFFYFDQQATQSYLQTATIRSAVKDIAAQFGFTPATASSASGNVQFVLTAGGTIARGFKLQSTSGVPFFLTNAIVAGAAGTYIGTALQGEVKTQTFIAQGVQNEEFDLIGPNIIVDETNSNPADISPKLSVGGNNYALVDSFLRFNGTDAPVVEDSLGEIIGGGGRVFQLKERPNGNPYIVFGDGIFGKKLLPGEIVTITYRTGGGTQGNIEPNSIVAVDSLPFVASVTNSGRFSGGADEQSIEQLRQLIPASLRILERAVSETDYSDLIVTNFSEVFAASTEVNTTDPGVDLNIYVVPQGNGIAKITDNALLLTNINNYIDRRKMVTIQFQVLDAFGLDTLITLEIFIGDTVSKNTVRESIQEALSNFFSLTTGAANGAGIGFAEEILLKDIYELVADIEGVDRVELKRLTYRPRIDFEVEGLVTQYQATEVSVFPNVSESEWLLAASGLVQETEDTVIFSNPNPTNFTYDSATGELSYQFPVSLDGVAPGDKFRNGPGLNEETEIQTVGDGTGAAEVSRITTRADEQGVQQVSLVETRADAFGDLGGRYFLLYDSGGSVAVWYNVALSNPQPSTGANRHIQVNITTNDTANTVASATAVAVTADSQFSASAVANVVTITNAEKLTVFSAVDGAIPTAFDISTDVTGSTPRQLNGTYFDIYDDVGAVRVWFDVDNTSTAPTTPGGGRLLEVDISANDPAVGVAVALHSILDGDSKFSASIVNNIVTATSSTVGVRTNITDGLSPTQFTFTVLTQGADPLTIDGTYFILYDINGAIAYWYDVDDSGTVEPAHGAARSVEINTVTGGMTAAQVATVTAAAVGDGIAEISTVVCSSDTSGSLNNKYFFLNAAEDATEYYVWFNVSAGGTDPAIAGKTGIEVAIATNDNANVVGAATRAAINSVAGSDFTASDLSGTVTITNDLGGACTDVADSISPNGTGFVFSVATQGASFVTSALSNVVTITGNNKAVVDDADAGTTGFTATVTIQGVEDNTDFLIFSVDIANSSVFILPGQPVNPIAGINAGGSIRNGDTAYQSFKCFKKLNATATNLSSDSITDTNIDLSIQTGSSAALSARILIDNAQVFVPGQYSTGDYYLVDGAGNIWEIIDNESNTITTSITAVNDAAITTVTPGNYRIVTKMIGTQVVFNGSVFNVQYNSQNTFVSVGAQFTQIGTIGDSFQVSKLQSNIGDLGVAVDLISFNAPTGQIRLNGSPDLSGISSGNILIDQAGQTFSVISVDNRPLPQLFYAESNQNDEVILEGTDSGQQYAQGFKVTVTDTYSIVSAYMRREGNIVGQLTARVVRDDGTGLPDVTQVVGVSTVVDVANIDNADFQKAVFVFTAPPTLIAGIQYHLVISSDVSYQLSQQDGVVVFANSGPTAWTYNILSGLIEYAGAVDLSAVAPGNFFEDNDGTLFQVLAVDDENNRLTLASGLPVIEGANGNVVAKDNIYVAIDDTSPSYPDGELARFDGAAWSNSSQGPDQFSTLTVAPFTVEGPKSLIIDSNLTPTLGAGATISRRYYDDENEISLAIGIASGIITSATDVNAVGRGTVSGVPNTPVDQFVFRTSRFVDDIVNIRKEEIPQLDLTDLIINIFGGID